MSKRLRLEYLDLENNFDERFFVDSTRKVGYGTAWECYILFEVIPSAYRNSSIKIELLFPPEYPFKCPKVKCLTPVFHPYMREGELCECIFRKLWRGGRGSQRTARWCLEQIYEMFVSDGTLYNGQSGICVHSNMAHIRDTEYVLFDSIIQRCLGLELPEDIFVGDIDGFDYTALGEWDTHLERQRVLNQTRRRLLTALFQGRFVGIQTTVLRFMGICAGTFSDKAALSRTYLLEEIKAPTETMKIMTLNGEVSIPKWSTFKVLDELGSSDSFQIPMTKETLQLVLELCKEEKKRHIRMCNPVAEEQVDWHGKNEQQTLAIVCAADFLGAERIVMSGCLHLSYLIKRASVAASVESVVPGNGRKAYFKTYQKL